MANKYSPQVGVTADLQFDAYMSYSRSTEGGVSSRLLDAVACFRWIVEQCHKHSCPNLLILGDVFDSRTTIDISVLDIVCREFADAKDSGLQVTVLVGNHDSYLRGPKLNSLQVLRGVATVIEQPCVQGGIAFVPWVDSEEQIETWVKQVAKDKNARYLMTHAMLDGVFPGKGVSTNALKPSRWDRIILGDVHDPIEIPGPCPIHYVGSPMQIDFRDAGKYRGFGILDVGANKWTPIENTVSPRFHIVNNYDSIAEIKQHDFARVKHENAKKAAGMTQQVKKVCDWVEGATVEVKDEKPRLDVQPSATREEVLRRYCVYNEVEDEDLIELGLMLLAEAEK